MVSELELKELKSQAREALEEAKSLLEDLTAEGMENELNADTLQWLIPQVKDALRRTDGKPKALAGDADAVGAIGALIFAVSETNAMLNYFALQDAQYMDAISAATHKLPPQ